MLFLIKFTANHFTLFICSKINWHSLMVQSEVAFKAEKLQYGQCATVIQA
jgi:hypothetical protein